MIPWRRKQDKAEPAALLKGASPVSDAHLVEAAREGDKRAFVEIVARYQGMVCGIAFGILGDFGASEDAGQEAFLTAWQKFDELREPERLRAWLGQIARNAALGYLRRKREHGAMDDSLMLVDESPGPDETAAKEEEAGLVRDSLAKLPEIYRLPLVLYYREGESVRAVAEALDISEDAVKQRLARGREMLRDRVTSLIEGVLVRTGPTSVFTMTIASAIGALAAPAVVAGTVFTASAVAAGSGSTVATAGSSAPIFTIMSTSKTFVATVACVAVVCIPVGYQLANPGAATEPKEVPVASSEKPVETAPSFDESALVAEWRALHEKHGSSAASMPVLFQAISELDDPVRRRAFGAALVAEWVQVDPAAGLAFFLQDGRDANQRRQFLEEWLESDPRAAVDALLANPGWERLGREYLPEIARQVPERVGEITRRLPKPDSVWSVEVRDAFAILAEGGLDGARLTAESMEGPNREQALSGVAQTWAKQDLEAAIAWAKKLPEGVDRNEVMLVALMGKAAVDPLAALENLDLVPPGGIDMYFAYTSGARVLKEAVKADFDGTVKWIAENPGRLGHQDLVGLSSAVADRLNQDPVGFLSLYASEGTLQGMLPAIQSALLNDASGQRTEVWEWLGSQPANEVSRSIKESVLNSAAYQDPELAIKLAAELPNSSDGKRELESLVRSIFNSGARLNRFEKVMELAPEPLRPTLVLGAFDSLWSETFDNPQVWVERLSMLPEDSRKDGTGRLAQVWAEKTPEDAVAWAETLPAGEGKMQALDAITSAWAAKDASAAGNWVASLPPGADRDLGAATFARSIAEKYPDQAWEWALSIGDSARRHEAAKMTAKIASIRDPSRAQQFIESGMFTSEEKAEIQGHPSRMRQMQKDFLSGRGVK